jgi:hypothetical protein
MHYVAARILAGAVPYRDLFDMNVPGVYLVHVLGLRLFGAGDLGFRALDLALLGGTAAGLAVALRPWGPWAQTSGPALFWLYHLAAGSWNAGQRDLILCLPLAWTAAAAVADLRRPRPLGLGLVGLGLGAAAAIKPHALLLGPALAALAWRHPAGARLPALALLGIGTALPAGGLLLWLARAGGLEAFVDIVGGYLLPLYRHLGSASILGVLQDHLRAPGLVGLGLGALGGFAALWRAGRADARVAVLGGGLAYGALHFGLQGKGWEYHLYPFALFAVAAGAAGLGAALASRSRMATGVLVAALALAAGGLASKGARSLAPEWIAAKQARVHAVAEALAPVVAAGGTVQVLDTTDGGVHALYLLGARQPTRFLYDFHFYHDVGHPYVERLRGELLQGLRARPPAAVVLFEHGWPSGGYERLATFPALATWLDEGFKLAREGDGYRIYAARGHR